MLRTMRISPSTKRRWSKPNRMCSMPCDRYAPATASGPCDVAMSTHGCGRPHQRGRMRAVEHLHAHQDVRDRRLQPDELNALPSQPLGARRR